MHRIASFALAAMVAFGAAAQPVRPGDDVEGARILARKGTSLYDLGKYSEALQAFESAYEKKPVPGLLFNIAQCHRLLGQLEEAARVYKSYLRSDPPEAAARQARELLAKVEDALAHQSTAVKAPPHGLSDSPGKPREPAPAAAVAGPPQPAPSPSVEHVRWPVYAAGGVAAGAAALGVVWALGSRSATNELTQLHQAGPVDPARDASLRSDASSQYSRSKVCYVAAAVAAAAGVALYFVF